MPNTHDSLVAAIYATHEAKRDKEAAERPRKGRLGCGRVGQECERAVWYEFHQCTPVQFDGRMLRLFERGHLEEPRYIAELKELGATVYEVNPQTGEQWEYTALGGHLAGYLDGVANNLPGLDGWHLLEFKTINAKGFAKVQAEGVAAAKPEYYGQAQLYMHLANLPAALFLFCNKNTDELYSEVVPADPNAARLLMERARRVIELPQVPPRISNDPDFFKCRFCDHKALCHSAPAPAPAVLCQVNCRNCVHGTADTTQTDAAWKCEKHGHGLNVQQQKDACPDHVFLPDLIGFADPIDSTAEGIQYQRHDGAGTFTNGPGKNDYKSKELATLPAPMVGAGIVDQVKGELSAEAYEAMPQND